MDQGNNNNTMSPFENAGLSRVGLEIDILNDQVLSSPNSDENTKILFSQTGPLSSTTEGKITYLDSDTNDFLKRLEL